MKDGDRICRRERYSKDFEIATVLKVYKNGNFIIKKGGEQFRSNGLPAGKSRAWSIAFWEPLDDAKLAKLTAEREAWERASMFYKAIEKLEKTVRHNPPVSTDQLARIEALVRELVK